MPALVQGGRPCNGKDGAEKKGSTGPPRILILTRGGGGDNDPTGGCVNLAQLGNGEGAEKSSTEKERTKLKGEEMQANINSHGLESLNAGRSDGISLQYLVMVIRRQKAESKRIKTEGPATLHKGGRKYSRSMGGLQSRGTLKGRRRTAENMDDERKGSERTEIQSGAVEGGRKPDADVRREASLRIPAERKNH